MQEFELYRHDNGDGTSKDWAIRIISSTLYVTRWGKTDTCLAGINEKTAKKHGEAHDLILSKERKGYVRIGSVMIDDNGNVHPKGTQPKPASKEVPPLPPKEEAIYWRVSQDRNLLISAMGGFQAKVADLAQAVGKVYPISEWGDVVKLEPFGLPNSASGQIKKENGVAPLLFLMAAKRIAPQGFRISISSEDSVEISDRLKQEAGALSFLGATLESIREVAEELGLLEKRLDLTEIETDFADFSF